MSGDLKATLVSEAGIAPVYTATCETDARTALTRGLADYLEGAIFNAVGGRQLRFAKVFRTWAEPEDAAEYPAAVVYSTSPATYDASKFTPTPNERCQVTGSPGNYLVSHSEMILPIQLEVWTNDPVARMVIVGGMERSLSPVDWMYGLMLDLPFYYGERAIYELGTMAYQDSEEDAMRRYRKAVFTLTGQVPVVNLFSYAEARPKVHLYVDGGGPAVVVPKLDVQVT